MSKDNLIESIKSAIADGNHEEARVLLRVALKEPTAEIYYLAAQVALNEQQRQSFLHKADDIDSRYSSSATSQSETNYKFQEVKSKNAKFSQDVTPTKPRKEIISFGERVKRASQFGLIGFVYTLFSNYVIMFLLTGRWIDILDEDYTIAVISMVSFIAWFIARFVRAGEQISVPKVIVMSTLFGLAGLLVLSAMIDFDPIGDWIFGYVGGMAIYSFVWLSWDKLRQ